ncbi:hypothetical protein IF1G_09530 [Cordyceps javanica]|uniref:Uncharacterized protein n=1 Tax=Cordyceps javanica TaxID=43265 RepID=A0A545UR55_9HYPO|nr:hypothetical protein IF1G_09530 [Cordyceps javanica]TQW03890.1 hypothetical protein IF2G_08719 [Cordyceps javanica]
MAKPNVHRRFNGRTAFLGSQSVASSGLLFSQQLAVKSLVDDAHNLSANCIPFHAENRLSRAPVRIFHRGRILVGAALGLAP